MEASDRSSVPVRRRTLGRQRHICAFSTVSTRHSVLRPFIRDGLDRGEKGFTSSTPTYRSNT